jgi:hypothetical protein
MIESYESNDFRRKISIGSQSSKNPLRILRSKGPIVSRNAIECIKFRRFLSEETQCTWNNLVDPNSEVPLPDGFDKVKWLLRKSGEFSIKSLYLYLSEKGVQFPYKILWKLQIPLCVNIFCWLVVKILSRDNLKKNGWMGSISVRN